jgi:class 3 adenylate cyclase
MTQKIGIIIFDSNAYTRALLIEQGMRMEGYLGEAYETVAQFDAYERSEKTIIIVLHQHDYDVSPLDFLSKIKAHHQSIYVILIVSPSGQKAMRESSYVDVVFEKPIDLNLLFEFIKKQFSHLNKSQQLAAEHLNLLRFLPKGELWRVFDDFSPGNAKLFDMVVMFTDIRNSSHWITQLSARDYFAKLNTLLGEQAQLIRFYEGMVVKTTGDGLLAVFAGVARCHLALKCSQAIQHNSSMQTMAVGVGLSDGLILTGLLGTPEHLHIDVIGMHVHLAARLCAQANAGEILATKSLIDKAHMILNTAVKNEIIHAHGFPQEVDCVRIPLQA